MTTRLKGVTPVEDDPFAGITVRYNEPVNEVT